MKKRILYLFSTLAIVSIFIAACAPAAADVFYQEPLAIGAPAPEADFSGERAEESANGGFDGSVGNTTVAQAAERLVIRNANLSIVVEDPEASMEDIVELAERLGGFVVSSNIYQTTTINDVQVPGAYITIRVPSATFVDALNSVRAEAIDVTRDDRTGQDVTAEYTDLQSRLRNLESAEEMLRAIMEEAQDTEDVLAAFNQLNYITEQIEVLKGQIQYYEESAAMSAITVELVANESVQPLTIGPWTPVGAAKDAVEALIRALQDIVDAVIWILLYVLPIVLVIALPLWLIGRGVLRLLRRRQAKPVARRSK